MTTDPTPRDYANLFGADMPTTCQYFFDSDHEQCPNPVDCAVEPRPVGQFAPALLCAEHAHDWIDDMAWNFGTDWAVTPLTEDGAERLRGFAHTAPTDDAAEMFCEDCGHGMASHAFFPGQDPHTLGEPAPLCVAAYKPEDLTLVDHVCECEGFVLYPKA